MAHRLTLPSGWHGWAVPIHHDDDVPSARPAEPVADSFLTVAGAWAFVTFEVLLLRAEGWIPDGAFGGRLNAALALCAGAGALSLLSAALYRLPAGIGGRLRFPALAWTHFTAMNLAALAGLWYLSMNPWLTTMREDLLVGGLSGLLGLGIACLMINVVASLESQPLRE